jgi:hypothetical protein
LIRLGAHAELLDGERVSAARDELRDEILSRYADTAAS